MIRKNTDGFTLVEILASITILSIIAFSFIAIFVQSARTTEVSEKMKDATYLAQSEIENIYNISLSPTNVSERETKIKGLGYSKCENRYCKAEINTGYFIELTIEKEINSNLFRVLVKVYTSSDKKRLVAQIESLLDFGG